MRQEPIHKTAFTALVFGAFLAVAAPSAHAEATDETFELAQNFDSQRQMELTSQRVPLESVIARIQQTCPGRLINARHDAGSNQYIVRWETSRQQIVSIQADAATGRILSTGGC
jgi:uncharacterized membrane protein YkoI